MSLSLKDVQYVASLARLGLSDDEMETMRDQLASILEHIAVLDALDTESISPTAQVIAVENIMRDDTVAPSLDQKTVTDLAPAHEGGFIVVPRVLGGDEIGGSA